LHRILIGLCSLLPLFAAPIYGVTVRIEEHNFVHIERYAGFLIVFLSWKVVISVLTRYISAAFKSHDKIRIKSFTWRDLAGLSLLLLAMIFAMFALLYLQRRLPRLPFSLLLLALLFLSLEKLFAHKEKLVKELVAAYLYSFSASFLTFYLLLSGWYWQSFVLGLASGALYLPLLVPKMIVDPNRYTKLLQLEKSTKELLIKTLPNLQILLPLAAMIIVTTLSVAHILPGHYVFAILAGAPTPKLRALWEKMVGRIARGEEPSSQELTTLISFQVGTITLFTFLLTLAGMSVY